MKKVLYSFLIFASATVFAQKNTNTKFAVANGAVGTLALFDAQKAYVQKANNFKTKATLPQNLKKYEFLADNGLTEVTFKKEMGTLDVLLLSDYNMQHKLPKDAPVLIDGYEFTDSSTKIFSDIIGETAVQTVNGTPTLVITTKKK